MAKAKKEKALLDAEEALRCARQFVEQMVAEGKSLGWNDDDIVMTARENKILTFSGAQRATFYRCLVALTKAVYHRPVSEQTVRDSFESMIFASLDGPAEQSEERIADAIKGLRKVLLSSADSWRIAYRLQWIESAELPFTYRDVQIVKPEAAVVRMAVTLPERRRRVLNSQMDEFLRESREGVGVAVAEVEAADEASARNLALSRIYDAVDELTGFAAIVYPRSIPVITDVFNSLRVSLATVAVNTGKQTAFVRFPVPLPSDIVRPKTLFGVLRKHAPASRVNSILGTAPDDEITDRIRACARYIGRAQQCTFEDRSDDAFLYLVVAMEALLGRKDFRDTIGYQLRMRVAHLIGTDVAERREIERDVIRLYEGRSKLVHQGTRQVRAFDLTQARSYAIRCLSTVLFVSPINGFRAFEELEEWFREKLLT